MTGIEPECMIQGTPRLLGLARFCEHDTILSKSGCKLGRQLPDLAERHQGFFKFTKRM